MRNILLYFGSFNPIHNGHVSIARWAAERLERQPAGVEAGISTPVETGFGDGIDELWLVVSPQNPLRTDLAPEADRLAMARIAMGQGETASPHAETGIQGETVPPEATLPQGFAGVPITVSDVEFELPKPSYAIDTLRFLGREHPDCHFSILMGDDILDQLPKWKEYEVLLNDYHLYVYPRARTREEPTQNITILRDAPELEFSSTQVRQTLLDGGDIGAMVPPEVAEYIEKHGLWRPTTAAGWLERGRRHQRQGDMSAALSDLLRAEDLDACQPENMETSEATENPEILASPISTEIAQRIAMLREIFDYHYTDYYNP